MNMPKLLVTLVSNQGRVAEFLIGVTTLLWGLWVWDTDVFSIATYQAFYSTGIPEHVWGIIVGAIGLLTILGTLLNKEEVRAVMMLANVVMWVFLSALFLTATPGNPSFAVHLMMGVMSAWLYVRILLFKEVDKEMYGKSLIATLISNETREDLPRRNPDDSPESEIERDKWHDGDDDR